eukprot:4860116-Pyramimonas_sp.AAC.1
MVGANPNKAQPYFCLRPIRTSQARLCRLLSLSRLEAQEFTNSTPGKTASKNGHNREHARTFDAHLKLPPAVSDPHWCGPPIHRGCDATLDWLTADPMVWGCRSNELEKRYVAIALDDKVFLAFPGAATTA